MYRIRIIRDIRKLSLEYVANISPERGSINDALTILSGAKFKIGLKSKSIYITSTFTKYYNKYYSFFSNSKLKNEYYALDDLLRYFNIDKRDNDKLFYCEENNFTPIENYILIAPSASESFRNWDKANFRILIQKLCDVKSHPIIILGTFRQSGIIQYISEGIDNTTIKIDLHFSEIIQLVYNCRLLVGLDSGITHIALQMRKPIIAIIGGGKYGKFFPYKNTSYVRYFYHEMDCFGCNWICKYKEPYCLTMVSVDDVFSSCNQLLDMK